ncbi:MAG: 16S rRNA (guanine(966)-N(2))-methyltransferase RsmD [Magnetospiraceae bacterium]
MNSLASAANPNPRAMRIIAGSHKGRRLQAPPGRTTRPTADRVRESLFNILSNGIGGIDLAGARVADLFAGSGAFGLEALSRGADYAAFVETDRQALTALRANLEACGAGSTSRVLACDATRLPRADAPFSLVFMDPPYGKDLPRPALESLISGGWVAPGSLVVVETGKNEDLPPPPGFDMLDARKYGAAKITLLLWQATAE